MRWTERLDVMLPRGREGDVCGVRYERKEQKKPFLRRSIALAARMEIELQVSTDIV